MFTLTFDEDTQQIVDRLLGAVYIEHIEIVLQRYYQAAGALVKYYIQQQLGHAALYELDPGYAQKKLENPFVYHVPDKDPTQPLILTGALYNSFGVHVDQNGVTVNIEGTSGFGRASMFQFRKPGSIDRTAMRENRRELFKERMQQRKVSVRKQTLVEEYAKKWEDKTHFMEKGLEAATPHLVELLGEYISNAINGLVWGGWSGHSQGFASLDQLSWSVGRQISQERGEVGGGFIGAETYSPISYRGGFDMGHHVGE